MGVPPVSDPAESVGPLDGPDPREPFPPVGDSSWPRAEDPYRTEADDPFRPQAGDPLLPPVGDQLPPRPAQRRTPRREEELPEELPPGQRNEVGKSSSLLRELPILVFVALALALLIKTFLVQAFFIPSDSMQNTLLEGDRVLVNKFSARFGDPKRGEIIVFRDPGGWLGNERARQEGNPVLRGLKDVFVFVGLLPSSNEKDLIKRVVGVPGDRVACCTDGKVTVNGVKLDEPYLYTDPVTGEGDKPSERPFSVTVPPNRLWVMGDHREVSADSRLHMTDPGNGTISQDQVVGRAFVLVWPLSRWSTLKVPGTFKTKELDDAPLAGSAAALVDPCPARRVATTAGQPTRGHDTGARPHLTCRCYRCVRVDSPYGPMPGCTATNARSSAAGWARWPGPTRRVGARARVRWWPPR